MADYILETEDMTKEFRGFAAVSGVNLRVQRGSIHGLIGPNGAGKTTCFYMITGLIPADSGSIWLDNEDITQQPMYQRARMGLGRDHAGARHQRALDLN